MQTYIDLHRHAAVRAALTAHPGVALRLMVAHAIGGSHLWTVKPEPQSTRNDEVRDSLDNSKGEADFDERRRAVLAVLGFDEDEPTIPGGSRSEEHTSELQSLKRNSYAVFCLKKKKKKNGKISNNQ